MNSPRSASAPAPFDEDRISGRARFSADMFGPDTLHAAFVLSTVAHARIVSVDTKAAAALPGVAAVLTGADVRGLRVGRRLRDYPVLADDRVLFIGQRVAAVAAVDRRTAEAAAALIDVRYEPLDPLLSIDDVMASGQVLHPDPGAYEADNAQIPVGNLQGGEARSTGDVESAFGTCDAVFEDVFEWPRSHAAPIEPHACLVVAGHPRTYVYSAHKEPYSLRRDLARLAQRPVEDFVVLPINIGGDFGSKGFSLLEPACYFLSVKTGRPVGTALSYFEELTSTTARHPGRMRVRTGVRGGRFHTYEMEAVLEGGAFAAAKALPPLGVRTVGLPLQPYAIPHQDERAITLYANTLPGGNVRSPGEMQALFAGESHVDIVARSLGEDPVEFRLANLEVAPLERVLRSLRPDIAAWRAEIGATADTGIGVAIFHRAASPGHTRVLCSAGEDGVDLHVGVPEQGSGMYAAFRAMAAKRLRVPEERIRIAPVGAHPELTDRGVGGSRVTSVAGRACLDACDALLQKLGSSPEEATGDTYWIADRLEELAIPSVEVTGEAEIEGPGAPAHGGLALQVSVDRDTGAYSVDRALLVVDGGEVVHPTGYRGQLEGGFVYGLSQARYEELSVEHGHVVAASLGDYKLATIGDIPPLEIRLLPPERQDGTDIRAVGELGNLGVAPAIANALDDAVGVRIRSLPITAEKVWWELQRAADGHA